MADMTCLAEGLVYPADFEKTGINLNEIVIGPTGCGKSYSNAYSRLIHTTDSSVVVPISKSTLKKKFRKMFVDRGYKVIDLDFTNPKQSNLGYDPMRFIHSEADVIQTARNLICGSSETTVLGDDPYWNESAISILAAEINLVKLLSRRDAKTPSFADVLELHRRQRIFETDGKFSSSLDPLFDSMARRYPGNQACELWKTIRGLAPKTASCIMSIVNNALDKNFTENIISMMKKHECVSFKQLGKQKTALFITTSPMNKTYQNYVNLLYADMFRELFESAENNTDNRLNIPVHIICDDFACGSRINNFEDYISIFRAAGISVTLLLQSETQLASMYGKNAATTIINNCDTYVYMGGMDLETCRNISLRINKPVHQILSMPLEQVMVFRRGEEPHIARRYQILCDPVYQQIMQDQEQEQISTPKDNNTKRQKPIAKLSIA